MSRLKFIALAMAMLIATGVAAAPVAGAGNQVLDYRLRGDAKQVDGGIRLRSDADPGFGRVNFLVPSGLRFYEIVALRTSFDPQADDALGGGSARFQLNLRDGSNVQVYVGTAPNFTDATPGPSRNLLRSGDARFDLSQLGGPFYGTYEEARALIGNRPITGIQLVVDSAWMFDDREQSIVVTPRVVVRDL